jgi:hypothetical protein
LLASEPRRITEVETYLSRSLALILLAFAALNLLLTGILPVTDSLEQATKESDAEGLSKDPYALPTVVVSTIYHAASAFYAYTQITYRGMSFAFTAGLTLSAALFCVGMWVILFGSEKGRISKKTGADKRTGNYPFVNEESARQIKKEAKEKEREEKEKEKEKKNGKRRSVQRTWLSRG